MISVSEALKEILGTIHPLGLEKLNIMDALGRVMGEDIYARRNIPPKNNSAMDGYAVRAEDTASATQEKPAILEVIEDIPAGTIPTKKIGPGQAARIMTGAPIPDGANAVMRMEDAEKDGNNVKIFIEASKGLDVRKAGEDVQDGELIIARGAVLRPADIGMLAALGRAFVQVCQKPLIAVLATGDELVNVDEDPGSWKIISSNSYSIAAQVLDAGGIPLQLGIAKDTREDLLAAFEAAMRADIIISSGGVSVGDYDLVKDIMKEMGNQMQFWQVAMRPGKPLAFGNLRGIPLFGLPGNPVSSMVSFEQFVRPSIRKMTGHKLLYRPVVKAILREDIKKQTGLKYFIRAVLCREDGRYTVISTGEQGSGILKSMVRANSFICLPEDCETARKGDEVTVQIIDHSFEQRETPEYLQI
ncbi:MAG: molybdopterin molybdotransferase MoeA [Deltaproteobacteria bacterium]|nr:molybdopterin molybdotransferase MoeA [Deltaproteobacteria bacterium]